MTSKLSSRKTQASNTYQSISAQTNKIAINHIFPPLPKRKKLFGGTVPPNNTQFGGTVPPNNMQFGGTLKN